MGLNFSTGSTEFEGRRLHGALAELDNAVIAFFWEGEKPLLGTLTVTLADGISYSLLGDRDRLICQLLGEQLVVKHGRMALVSTNLSHSTGSAAGKTLLELAGKLKVGGSGPSEAGL